jgi:hypothetical protein
MITRVSGRIWRAISKPPLGSPSNSELTSTTFGRSIAAVEMMETSAARVMIWKHGSRSKAEASNWLFILELSTASTFNRWGVSRGVISGTLIA